MLLTLASGRRALQQVSRLWLGELTCGYSQSELSFSNIEEGVQWCIFFQEKQFEKYLQTKEKVGDFSRDFSQYTLFTCSTTI